MIKKLRPGQARIQFIKYKEEIFDLLEKGHTIISVFELLKEQNKTTMSYSSFLRLTTGRTASLAKVISSRTISTKEINKNEANNEHKKNVPHQNIIVQNNKKEIKKSDIRFENLKIDDDDIFGSE